MIISINISIILHSYQSNKLVCQLLGIVLFFPPVFGILCMKLQLGFYPLDGGKIGRNADQACSSS